MGDGRSMGPRRSRTPCACWHKEDAAFASGLGVWTAEDTTGPAPSPSRHGYLLFTMGTADGHGPVIYRADDPSLVYANVSHAHAYDANIQRYQGEDEPTLGSNNTVLGASDAVALDSGNAEPMDSSIDTASGLGSAGASDQEETKHDAGDNSDDTSGDHGSAAATHAVLGAHSI